MQPEEPNAPIRAGWRDRGIGQSIRLPVERAWRWLMAFLRTPGRLNEFLRYTAVSGISLAIDIAVFALLINATATSAALAGAFSCMAGLLVHYVLSVMFVFRGAVSGKSGWRLVSEYALTGAMGFIITAGAIVLVTDVGGAPAFIGKCFGIAATFISVYLVRAGFVFAPAKAGDTAKRTSLTAAP